MSDRQLYVYVDLDGAPVLVGRLWARVRKGRESATFEYDDTWLKHPQKFALEPALALGRGPQHTPAGREIFGAMGTPLLIVGDAFLFSERNAAKHARTAARHTPSSSPNLTMAISHDLGPCASQKEGGPYLASQVNIPPLMELKELLGAAMRFDADDDNDADLKLLLAPGSSLGGARPKASIIDRDDHLTIAKFPKRDDTIPVSPWEATALSLAAKARIKTTDWRMETVAGRSVLLVRRFDRRDGQRIPFLSAMSMLGAADGDQHSYMEIADAIRQYGANAGEDFVQLWRRVIFNTDQQRRSFA